MLIIEKVFLLKKLDLFREMSETNLIAVAEILEEVVLENNQILFEKGDKGDSMYIMQTGSVLVELDGKPLVTLKAGEYFGELSLLDFEKRSATVKTLEETYLLKLRQNQFYDLIEHNSHVMRGIIITLCRRLRRQNEASVGMLEGKEKRKGDTE